MGIIKPLARDQKYSAEERKDGGCERPNTTVIARVVLVGAKSREKL
jgi:hypothetical protein